MKTLLHPDLLRRERDLLKNAPAESVRPRRGKKKARKSNPQDAVEDVVEDAGAPDGDDDPVSRVPDIAAFINES